MWFKCHYFIIVWLLFISWSLSCQYLILVIVCVFTIFFLYYWHYIVISWLFFIILLFALCCHYLILCIIWLLFFGIWSLSDSVCYLVIISSLFDSVHSLVNIWSLILSWVDCVYYFVTFDLFQHVAIILSVFDSVCYPVIIWLFHYIVIIVFQYILFVALVCQYLILLIIWSLSGHYLSPVMRLSWFDSFHYLILILICFMMLSLACHYLLLFVIWLLSGHYLVFILSLSDSVHNLVMIWPLFHSVHYLILCTSWSLFVIIWFCSVFGHTICHYFVILFFIICICCLVSCVCHCFGII